jgi:methanogenic corrinoid protein MtbC1
LAVQRTAGGHRRIPLQEAVRFVRSEGYHVQDPTCFGVLCTRGQEESLDIEQTFYAALIAGDAERCRALMTTAYLGGQSVSALCDGPLRAAMRRMGELWKHGEEGIAVEHHATSICIQVIEQLRQFLPDARRDAPVALGGGTADDPYLIPNLMVSVVLSECGYRAVNLGAHTPDNVLLAAVAKHKPVLVWRSLSSISDVEAFAPEVRELTARLGEIPLVIGGRYAVPVAQAVGGDLHVVGTMCELAAFARALVLRRPRTTT